MTRIGYLWLFLWIFPAIADEKCHTIDVYSGLMYNLLLEHVATSADYSLHDVRIYLHGKQVKPVFNDAFNMGYSKRAVIKRTYFIALRVDPIHELIVQALQEDMRSYQKWKDFYYWGVLSGTALSSLVSLFSIGFFIKYHVRDLAAINHYIQSNYAYFLNPYGTAN